MPAPFRKGFEANNAESYFLDSETKGFSPQEKLAGCLVHLIAKGKTSSLRGLFDNPSWELWCFLTGKISVSATCLNIISLLNETKLLFLGSQYNSQLSTLAEGFINTALTKIFYGCWGISDTPAKPDVAAKLLGIAQNIGKGNSTSLYATANQIIGSYDQYKTNTATDRFQEHYLLVANAIAEGSTAAQPIKNHLISMFQNRKFNDSSIKKILGSASVKDTAFPKTPIVGVMSAIISDSQIRKNIAEGTLKPALQSYLSEYDYTDSELLSFYKLIVCSEFDLPNKEDLTKIASRLSIPKLLPTSTKLWFILSKDSVVSSKIGRISEQDIEAQLVSNRQFKDIMLNDVLMESINRPCIPTWLRLFLLNKNTHFTKKEASEKALEIIKSHKDVAKWLSKFQKETFGSRFIEIITLYDKICKISKPCCDVDFETHEPFLDLCLSQSESSDLDFDAKRDLFKWIRELRAIGESLKKTNKKIAEYQTIKVMGALHKWKGTLNPSRNRVFEDNQEDWFHTRIAAAVSGPGFSPDFGRARAEFIKPLLDLSYSSNPFNYRQDWDIFKQYSEREKDLATFKKVIPVLTENNFFRLEKSNPGERFRLVDCGWNIAYKRLCLILHPDKNPRFDEQATIAFTKLNNFNSYLLSLINLGAFISMP